MPPPTEQPVGAAEAPDPLQRMVLFDWEVSETTTAPVVGEVVTAPPPVTEATAPPPAPQSDPVPETTPEPLTCRHCVSPVMAERINPGAVALPIFGVMK